MLITITGTGGHADGASWLDEAVLLDSYLSLIRNLNIELKPW